MKTLRCIFLLLFSITINLGAQNSSMNYADSAYMVPSSACLACPGSEWQNPMNIALSPAQPSPVFLTAYHQCFQSTCYFTREFHFCNYGFNLPSNATVDSFWVHINEGSWWTQHVIVDSVVQLMKNHVLVGNNYAWPYTWAYMQSVYYPSGLWGTTWTPAEVNDPGFGLSLRAKNTSTDTATAFVSGSYITVWYSTPAGVFSQSSNGNLFSVYPNPSTGLFFLELDQLMDVDEIRVADLTGRIILIKKTNGAEKINLENIPEGNFILLLMNKKNGIVAKKMISVVR
jgi:hypothetical protein